MKKVTTREKLTSKLVDLVMDVLKVTLDDGSKGVGRHEGRQAEEEKIPPRND